MRKNNTLKNILFNITYQVLAIIIPLITAPYISRVVGADGVGIYSYSTTIASYFAIFMLLGVVNYGSRSIAMCVDDEQRSKTFCSIFALQLCVSCLIIAVYGIFISFTSASIKFALIAQIAYLLSVMLDINWYFTGTGQFKVTVTRGILIKILTTVCIFVFVKGPDDVILYISIISAGSLLGNGAVWAILLRQIRVRMVSIKDMLKHLKPNILLFLPLLASSVFIYMDKLMLNLITGTVANVGYFEYAEKIVRLPLSMITAIGAVMMPKISSNIKLGKLDECRGYMALSMRYIGITGIAMTFGIAGMAPELSVVYLGKEFEMCGLLMQALSPVIIISAFANIIRTQYLIPNRRDKEYAIAITVGAVVNLVLNGILISKYGAIGAAFGTLGAELAVCIGHMISVRGELHLKTFIREWAEFAIYGALMFFVMRMIGTMTGATLWGVAAEFICGAAVYFVLGLVFLLRKRDMLVQKLIRKITRRTDCM